MDNESLGARCVSCFIWTAVSSIQVYYTYSKDLTFTSFLISVFSTIFAVFSQAVSHRKDAFSTHSFILLSTFRRCSFSFKLFTATELRSSILVMVNLQSFLLPFQLPISTFAFCTLLSKVIENKITITKLAPKNTFAFRTCM